MTTHVLPLGVLAAMVGLEDLVPLWAELEVKLTFYKSIHERDKKPHEEKRKGGRWRKHWNTATDVRGPRSPAIKSPLVTLPGPSSFWR
jgi:hypothetical protein